MLAALRRSQLAQRTALLAPSLAIIGGFMVLPLILMAYVSILEKGTHGGVEWGTYSAEAYIKFLFERDLMGSLSVNADYLQIFLRSFVLSGVTVLLALAIGFPTALYIALQDDRWYRNLLVFMVTIPFWTNLLVRNYAWIILLRNNGLIDNAAAWLGLTQEPIDVLYTPFAIGVGLTYSFLPFMVLPIYASLEKLDLRLVEAAFDLGADRRRALARIVVPLALPGIIAGCILVFVPCLGAYVTPELLGGSKSLMIGNLIQNQFGAARNWPFGAALGFALLAIVLLAMMAYALRFRRAPGGGT
ncbi:ABC transporter permease [Ferruginivarius sediminum]|uniref:ABC transporter permease n=1 Tax=Ferruginivarius sediminum TaxID=2661937 RepID=A0A369TG69_9PROT|nr:ABC transporter permease [Ferruginivarius sediminum]RDD63117.1 ABC transporter permease [Ferruginivarius sediminum]